VGGIKPGEVQIWWSVPGSFTAEHLSARVRSLPEEERASASGLAREEDRQQSLLTRVMVRRVLTEVEGILPPEAWRFGRNRFGRPRITNPDREWLSFNVSHTATLVVCAVTNGGRIGVDIESLTRRAPLEIADRYFSAAEATSLRLLPPALRSRRFFEHWTLKEAFAKALGRGVTLPFDRASFHFAPAGLTVAFGGAPPAAGEVAQDVQRWQFFLGDLPPSHILALAMSGGGGGGGEGGAAPQITIHAAEPLLRDVAGEGGATGPIAAAWSSMRYACTGTTSGGGCATAEE
jgi:4'-phosphopantetheinyl transferase